MWLVALVLLAAAGPARALPREVATHEVLAAKAAPEEAFHSWVKLHGKAYIDDEMEYERRREIWKDNLEFVHDYNSRHTTHWLGMNAHADLSHEEFKATRLGYNAAARAPRPRRTTPYTYAGVDHKKLPKAVDWRDHGAVSHVKNQEQCGSCWAFSTTGAIEGVNALYTGHMEVLSEQELLDCDTKHDHGCEGGLMDTAFEWVVKNHGIDTENDYKYHAQEGICSVNRRKRDVVTIDSYDDVPSESQKELKKAVAHQPIATAIEADQRDFQLYSGGVMTADCGTGLDHGVLIAGYGRENHTDYWLIKNSWGEFWGDHGYIKLARSDEDGPGQCGLAMQPSFPVKKHDNPPRPPKPAPDPPPPAPAPGPGPAPGPHPQPVVCDATTECFPDTTCCCMQSVSKVCMQWACCPIPKATCCDDHIHCCPHNLPVCDVDHGRCLPKLEGKLGLEAGLWSELQSGPIYEKVPAQRSFSRSSHIVPRPQE